MTDANRRLDDLVDPDPFSLAVALLNAVHSGVCFLFTRRQANIQEQRYRGRLISRFYAARRTLNMYRRDVDDFHTYKTQERFGSGEFRLGGVSLMLSGNRSRQYRALLSRYNDTAYRMATDLNALSEMLPPKYQANINRVQELLQEAEHPATYDGVFVLASLALRSCEELLAEIEEQERLTEDQNR